MKAIVYDRYGPLDVLQLREVTKPLPKDGGVDQDLCYCRIRKADPFLSRLFNGLWRPKRIKILGFERRVWSNRRAAMLPGSSQGNRLRCVC